MPMEVFVSQCTLSDFAFIDRPDAEQDPGRKQIIPYILLQTRDKKMTAVYNRKGSEKRLHDLWSVGIGGHINPMDNIEGKSGFEAILRAGMERELDEELICRPSDDRIDFLGVISEDITPVGSVHLGAVFKILTDTPDAYEPGAELYRFQWKKTSELQELTMELWSELALELARQA